MAEPSVSVIIPSYNSAAFVTEAIDSVLSQTRPPTEILVIDDGSQDDTVQRLARYASRILYVRQKNQGVAAARNRGIQESRGELIAFLDADDVWHPRKLEIQIEVMCRHPELGLLGTLTFPWPVAGDVVIGPIPGLARVAWKELVLNNAFVTSTVLIRRKMLETAGLFDVTLRGPEDYDLWLRIAELAPAANLPLPLTGYRVVAGSLSRQAVRMENDLRSIFRKLDRRHAWGSDWSLRRKALSSLNHTACLLYREQGANWTALTRLFASLFWYPLPFRRGNTTTAFERPRMLAVTLLDLLRLRRTLS